MTIFSGMLSERNEGASISEVCGIYLGGVMQNVMRVFSVVLLVMVGTVFAVGPAGLIVTSVQQWRSYRCLFANTQKYGCGSFWHITLLQHLFLLIRS